MAEATSFTRAIAAPTAETAVTAPSVLPWIAVTCAPICSVARGLGGELLHLARHHREALARLARARRLDRGVQRQQVGLAGDVGDEAHHLADLRRGLGQAAHGRVGGLRALHRLARRLRGVRHLARDLAHAGAELLGRRGDVAQVARALLRARGGRRGAVPGALHSLRHRLRRAAHLPGRAAERGHHPGDRLAEVLRVPLLRRRAAVAGGALGGPARRQGVGLPQPGAAGVHGARQVAQLVGQGRAGQVEGVVAPRELPHGPGQARQAAQDAAVGPDGGGGGDADAQQPHRQDQPERMLVDGAARLRRDAAAPEVVVSHRRQALAEPGIGGAHLAGVERRARRPVAGAGQGEQPIVEGKVGAPGGRDRVRQPSLLGGEGQRLVVAPGGLDIPAGAGEARLLPRPGLRTLGEQQGGLELAVAHRVLRHAAEVTGAGQPILADLRRGAVHRAQLHGGEAAQAQGEQGQQGEDGEELRADAESGEALHGPGRPSARRPGLGPASPGLSATPVKEP
jgi:hypothetical protein